MRQEGILIVCSGNSVHNLGLMHYERDADPFPWAVTMDQEIQRLILENDSNSLIHYGKLGKGASLAVTRLNKATLPSCPDVVSGGDHDP